MNSRHKLKYRRQTADGFSLVELVIAIAILMVLATGGLSYLYHSNLGAKKSEALATAARLASLLLNSWKGNGGGASFNPINAFEDQFTITDSPNGPPVAMTGCTNTFTLLNNYHIVLGNINYYVSMSYCPATANDPLALSVCVAWLPRYSVGVVSQNDTCVRLSAYGMQ